MTPARSSTRSRTRSRAFAAAASRVADWFTQLSDRHDENTANPADFVDPFTLSYLVPGM